MEFSTTGDYKSCKDDGDSFQMAKFVVTENRVSLKPTQDVKDSFQSTDRSWSYFGYHCLVNDKCDPIVVICGGNYRDGTSLCLLNMVTKQIQFKSKVGLCVIDFNVNFVQL